MHNFIHRFFIWSHRIGTFLILTVFMTLTFQGSLEHKHLLSPVTEHSSGFLFFFFAIINNVMVIILYKFLSSQKTISWRLILRDGMTVSEGTHIFKAIDAYRWFRNSNSWSKLLKTDKAVRKPRGPPSLPRRPVGLDIPSVDDLSPYFYIGSIRPELQRNETQRGLDSCTNPSVRPWKRKWPRWILILKHRLGRLGAAGAGSLLCLSTFSVSRMIRELMETEERFICFAA